MSGDYLVPEWAAPASVRAIATTRLGGLSTTSYAGLNLATHVGDDPANVDRNRQLLRQTITQLPADPLWLQQVHGARVAVAEDYRFGLEADACVAHTPGLVCAVLSADCLPILLCADDGSVVSAVHAGWRGMAAGVIEACVSRMGVPSDRLLAWLGPAIGPRAYEVGEEVRAAFCADDEMAALAFHRSAPGKWLCDLYSLATRRFAALGVRRVFGGGLCTFSDSRRFYSFRRDGTTGRMASCIWIAPSG